jgi:hypothetical protein
MNKNVKTALIRFLRTILPQIPAVLSALAGLKPELTVFLTFLGAVVTAADKFLRDSGAYEEVPFL